MGDWRPAGPPCGGDHRAGEAQNGTGVGLFDQEQDTGYVLDIASHLLTRHGYPQIFWLKREREMKDVLQAADTIRKILAGAAAE